MQPSLNKLILLISERSKLFKQFIKADVTSDPFRAYNKCITKRTELLNNLFATYWKDDEKNSTKSLFCFT
ncbi:uncharacterized protein LOC124355474 [Homalodisca vitripennis]|uniref:uncharacterized protein LOC124355474 n=1 Tax=Homalodisca vitripennis TaxID=197043 RepID=UPI001EEB137F|nr:uncharacterized protein LOC124355474 [Homalodisca vitripennis]